MRKQQKGFTLIELVMVIVILGILAAFALPKFADLSQNANISSIEGARGAVKSATGIAHAAFLAGGSSASVNLEGSYTLTFGYPAADDIAAIAGLDGYDISTATATVQTIALSSGTCSFTYTEATDASTPPVVSVRTGADCP